MSYPRITHKTRTTRPRSAGTAARTTEYTEARNSDGDIAHTTIWSRALLRRLTRENITREQYIELSNR
jgi:hypothetical protein